jgi:hypothetical protein
MRRLLLICALWVGVWMVSGWMASSQAAVTPNSAVTMQTPTRGVVQFLQGTDSAGTYKTVYTAQAPGPAASNGARCNALWLTTDDTVPHLVTVQLTNGGIRYGGTAVLTIASAGYVNAVPAMNLLSPTLWPGLPLDSDGNPYLQLASGDTLQATYAAPALTASTRINLVISCGEF